MFCFSPFFFCFCFYLLSLNFTRLGFGFVPVLRVSAPGPPWDAGPDSLLVGFLSSLDCGVVGLVPVAPWPSPRH